MVGQERVGEAWGPMEGRRVSGLPGTVPKTNSRRLGRPSESESKLGSRLGETDWWRIFLHSSVPVPVMLAEEI
jgi:hypothetical protein